MHLWVMNPLISYAHTHTHTHWLWCSTHQTRALAKCISLHMAPKKEKGPQFCHPWGIAPKISKDLSGILATPRAKFHADRWSPCGKNCDRRKTAYPSIWHHRKNRATISLSLGVLLRKFQKTCLGYWRWLMPNFTPFGEVAEQKTVTEQKAQ